jgi:hypothetical protein
MRETMVEFDDSVVSPRFLTRVLRRPVSSVGWARVGAERGFASVVVRLAMDPAGQYPETIIAKVTGPGGAGRVELDREVVFYRDVAAAVGAPAPRCWYAGPGPAGMPVLLLGDLSAAGAGDALAGSGIADVRRVLHAMVPPWSHGERAPAQRLPRWAKDPATWRERQDRFTAQWDTVAEALDGQVPDQVLAVGRRLRDQLAGWVLAPLADSAHTVVHTDLHLDNVLFAGTDQPPVVIDWPSACIGPLAVDVFPFLATSLSPHEHEHHAAATVEDLARRLPAALRRPGLLDDGRRAMLRHFAGVIGWLARPATGNPRETALRKAALGDGRLPNALVYWNVEHVLRP